MDEVQPNNANLLERLLRFGPPIYVPAGAWRVAGVQGTPGQPDGVLVFGGEGEVEVRTELFVGGVTPISSRVRNVQGASVMSPDPEVRSRWDRVVVDEVERAIVIDGQPVRVRALQSHNSFGVEIVLAERIVSVGGKLEVLDQLRIERRYDLSLTGHA